MNIFKFFLKPIITVRAASKEQKKAERKYIETHMQLARELGLDVEFRARMGEVQGVK
ncbi:hypothetical protein [Maritalea porphyrae]|jgi:hypothetical protein|uniref:hypothetical protein n=1 Tax=Maritalea porphyrae TaxID=880732 RepID=UPI0022AE62B7|nr:hypothetical protein [Maritalea porphyrae]MCZ4270920.1 hypothetical protein [Maritalea porphyrae]